jgi:hypothetical protein
MTLPSAVGDAAILKMRIILGAMAYGVVLYFGIVVFLSLRAAGRTPDAAIVGLVNSLTIVTMACAVAAVVASEFFWRKMIRAAAADFDRKVAGAFILRSALREIPALLGLTALLLSAVNGVLRVFPAYWVNAAPAGLFIFFAVAHWPSPEALAAELNDAAGLPPAPPIA